MGQEMRDHGKQGMEQLGCSEGWVWVCRQAIRLRRRDVRGNWQDTGDEGDAGEMQEMQGMQERCGDAR